MSSANESQGESTSLFHEPEKELAAAPTAPALPAVPVEPAPQKPPPEKEEKLSDEQLIGRLLWNLGFVDYGNRDPGKMEDPIEYQAELVPGLLFDRGFPGLCLLERAIEACFEHPRVFDTDYGPFGIPREPILLARALMQVAYDAGWRDAARGATGGRHAS